MTPPPTSPGSSDGSEQCLSELPRSGQSGPGQFQSSRSQSSPISSNPIWSGRFGFPDTRDLLHINPSPFALERFREKRWCYVGVINPDLIFSCAVIHLGYLTSAFAFGFDRKEKRMISHTSVLPSLGQVCFDRNPEQGICTYRGPLSTLTINNRLHRSESRITASFFFPGKSLTADIEILRPDPGLSPVHFLMPMETGQQAFTTKAAGFKAQGTVRLNRKSFDLMPENTFALYDWTNGFFPRQTAWNWACGAGLSQDGTALGLNFSAGVYTRGLLENTVWINGRPFSVRDVFFSYSSQNPEAPWQIRNHDRSVDLTFEPEAIRRANDNFGLIQSRFIQPCGTFTGKIALENQPELHLSSMGGVVEEHFARW